MDGMNGVWGEDGNGNILSVTNYKLTNSYKKKDLNENDGKAELKFSLRKLLKLFSYCIKSFW